MRIDSKPRWLHTAHEDHGHFAASLTLNYLIGRGFSNWVKRLYNGWSQWQWEEWTGLDLSPLPFPSPELLTYCSMSTILRDLRTQRCKHWRGIPKRVLWKSVSPSLPVYKTGLNLSKDLTNWWNETLHRLQVFYTSLISYKLGLFVNVCQFHRHMATSDVLRITEAEYHVIIGEPTVSERLRSR